MNTALLPKRYTPVVLQPRDRELLHYLSSDYVLLTREQIAQLFPGRSVRRTNFRLRKLLQAGYLSRRYPAGLLMSHVPLYYLGPRAAEPLALDPGDPKLRLRRKQALQLRDGALPHFLLVNAIHIKFLTASREYPDYELLNWIPQHAPIWGTLNQYGFPLRPDGYAECRQAAQLSHFFIELDRGSERGDAIRKKFLAYAQYARSGRFQAQFSAHDFRVLCIVPSWRRARPLLQLMHSTSPQLFAITSADEFFRQGLLEPHWKSSDSEIPQALLISL